MRSIPSALLAAALVGLVLPGSVVRGTPERGWPGKQADHDRGASAHMEDDEHHDPSFDHKAILGSEDEEEQFSQLTPEVAKERLGKLVDLMDEDHSGYVDKAELAHWIANSFKKINAAEAVGILKSEDLNKDGELSWEEHMQKTYNANTIEEVEKSKEPANAQYAKIDQARFEAADLDKNGKLNSQELAAFLHPYDYDHMTPNEVNRLVNEMDGDHDGKISYKEFVQNEQKEGDAEEQKNFESHDLNGDKMLDRAELAKWIAPGSNEVVDMEVDHLFNSTDKNSDQKLSKEEIVNEYEMWVGSEATDYGNHLDREEL